MLGLEAKDVLDVLLVPIAIGVLGVVAPWAQERRKRSNYEELARRELQEARPDRSLRIDNGSWHVMLPKRFLHEAVISNPADTCDFVLSLNPNLAYYLAQLWMNFHKAEEAGDAADGRMYAKEWCYFLRKTCVELDRLARRYQITAIWTRRGSLVEQVWQPWHEELEQLYTDHTCETSSVPQPRTIG